MRGGTPGFFAATLTVAALFCLAGYQVTSATAAPRLLSRLGVAIVELDRWLPNHTDDVQLLARDRPQGTVRLADLPVSVTLPASRVVGADLPTLRSLVYQEMGRTLYGDGNGAFRDREGNPRKPAITEPVRWTVVLLGKGAHNFWKAALPVSLLLAVAATAGVLMGGRSPLLSLAGGSVFATLSCIAVWLLADAASGLFGSAVDKETLLILRDGTLIGLRDSLAVALVTLSTLVLLMTFGRDRLPFRTSTQRPPDAPSV